MKFGFIAKHRSVRPVVWHREAKALGSSRDPLRGGAPGRSSTRSRTTKVRQLIASARTYGARRLVDVLADGVSCGLYKIERLMRANALSGRGLRASWPAEGRRFKPVAGRTHLDRQVLGRSAEPQMDRRLHVRLDGRGLALRRGSHRSVPAPRRRLVDEGRDGDGDVERGPSWGTCCCIMPICLAL